MTRVDLRTHFSNLTPTTRMAPGQQNRLDTRRSHGDNHEPGPIVGAPHPLLVQGTDSRACKRWRCALWRTPRLQVTSRKSLLSLSTGNL